MKALVLDIDSTIYEHRSHTISKELLKQLARYQQAGFAIILATSRSQTELKHMPKAFRDFPFDYQILNGGALILDKEKTPLFKSLIDPESLQKLSDFFDAHHFNWRYVSEEGDYFAHKPDRSQRDIMNYFYLQAPDHQSWKQEPVYSLLVWLDTVPEGLRDLVKDLHAVDYYGAMEISAKDICKGFAFDWLKAHAPLEEAVVFGDGDNDIELFERADLAVAPQNAADKVREKADFICSSVYENGVGQFLEQRDPQSILKEKS